jgi:hypothetical protein
MNIHVDTQMHAHRDSHVHTHKVWSLQEAALAKGGTIGPSWLFLLASPLSPGRGCQADQRGRP